MTAPLAPRTQPPHTPTPPLAPTPSPSPSPTTRPPPSPPRRRSPSPTSASDSGFTVSTANPYHQRVAFDASTSYDPDGTISASAITGTPATARLAPGRPPPRLHPLAPTPSPSPSPTTAATYTGPADGSRKQHRPDSGLHHHHPRTTRGTTRLLRRLHLNRPRRRLHHLLILDLR